MTMNLRRRGGILPMGVLLLASLRPVAAPLPRIETLPQTELLPQSGARFEDPSPPALDLARVVVVGHDGRIYLALGNTGVAVRGMDDLVVVGTARVENQVSRPQLQLVDLADLAVPRR